MKRFLCVLLSFGLLISVCSCGQQQSTESEGEVVCYYVEKDAESLSGQEMIGSEMRSFSDENLLPLINVYLRGPQTDTLVSPYPQGSSALDSRYEDGIVTLVMSGQFFQLSGIDMSIAGYCLAKTVCEMEGVSELRLEDQMGSISLDFTPTQYVLSKDFSEETGEAFTLYFPDESGRYLVSESRTAILSENETAYAYIVRQLLLGPQNSRLEAAAPSGTTLRNISVSGSICSVDFSREFISGLSNDPYDAYTTIYAFVDTLTGLEEIDAVQFLCEGRTISEYGIFPLSDPVPRNTSAIGPVKISSGETDVNIYILREDREAAFAVPQRVRQTASQPLAETVVRQALDYNALPGFYNPIPFGTKVISASVSGSVCYVDLTESFVPTEDTRETETAAVWALVLPLTSLEEIDSVQISIEGENAGMNYIDLSDPIDAAQVQSWLPEVQ